MRSRCTRPFGALLFGVLLLTATAVAAGGCRARTAEVPAAESPSTDSASDVHTYTIRGRILQVDGPDLWIRHEAIPDFVGPDGAIESMHPMTMSFPLDEGLAADVAVPDRAVEFTLEVDWNAAQPARIISLTALPDDVELALEEEPAAGAADQNQSP